MGGLKPTVVGGEGLMEVAGVVVHWRTVVVVEVVVVAVAAGELLLSAEGVVGPLRMEVVGVHCPW